MAPHGDSLSNTFSNNNKTSNNKPPKISSDHLQRTVSDITFELAKETLDYDLKLTSISEVEDAKCECCGMSEECTPEYINRVREKFERKFVCGLCSEAVKEELEKNGGKKEEALSTHMHACVRFNKFGRAFPVLFQAQAMKEMLKKSNEDGRSIRAKSISPRDAKGGVKKLGGGLSRSSSCIPALTREINDIKIAN